MTKRSYGSGRLYTHTDAHGAGSWYGAAFVGRPENQARGTTAGTLLLLGVRFGRGRPASVP